MKCRMGMKFTKKTKFNDVSRVRIILILLLIVFAVSISIPSFARYQNYVNLEAMFNDAVTWDGSIATSYTSGTGTEEDPYIISTPAEFAYFAQEVDNNNGYVDTYFRLDNNIILNNGLFGYDETNVTYTLNDTLFYLEKYTGNAYDNANLSGVVISSVNVFDSISSFSGHFDGNYYTVYGMYLTQDTTELALINTLTGTFENVHFKNALVYGGSSTAILANNASGATVSNVSTDGIVVGTGDTYSSELITSVEDTSISASWGTSNKTITFDVPSGHTYTSVTLTGTYSSSGWATLTIGGQSVSTGDISVSLDGTATSVQASLNGFFSSANLTNLKAHFAYNYPISSGLIAKTNDSTFNNVINKADIYGTNVSGLLGITSDITLTNSYNNGNLKGTNVSGLVSQIINNTSTIIDKTYNNGTLTGTTTNYIGEVNTNDNVTLSNSFNTQSGTSTFGFVDSTVTVTNVYDVNNTATTSGSLNGTINVITGEDINNSLYSTLGFNEYVDNEDLANNPDNIWVYEYNSEPVLYIDGLNNPIASLNIGIYNWNDLGYDVPTRKMLETKEFSVTPLNGFSDFKNVYYYIYDGDKTLSRSNIESIDGWVEYQESVTLDKEGYYVVYVKVVTNDDSVFYINSDVLFFDLYGPNIDLTLEYSNWNSYREILDKRYVNDAVSLTAVALDNYSEVVSTEYYVANEFVSKDDISDDSWITYEGSIDLDKNGTRVVYVRSTDSNGHINIINSDYIIYGGYSESLNVGMNTNNLVDIAYITDKSSVVYKFNTLEDIPFTDGYDSNLVLSNMLPMGTKITFVDHILNNAYSYEVDNEDMIIPLSKFILIGNKDNKVFDEVEYLVTSKKDVSVVFDFSNATVTSDFNFNVYLDLRDESNNVVFSTLKDNVKETYVYTGLSRDLTITNNSVIYGINYDSNSKNVIDFKYTLGTLTKDNIVVNDTYNEHMKTGIAIRLVDSEGATIYKKYLKNMEFIVDGVNYSADSDGVVRINMSDNLNDVTGSLTIVTYENDFDLKDGDYSLVINPYIADDGRYTDTFATSNISIPVVSDYQEILDYNFNVKMDEESRILIKDSGSVVIPFEILSINEFSDPSVRVSLYKKNNLTAYDQIYTLIDLDLYSSNELELATDYSYIVSGNKLDLNLDLSGLEKTGYEIRFELFDGDTRIDLIKKKFIVR